jgi:protein-S-isoprenylcysteine O-methyltransferase Ste14
VDTGPAIIGWLRLPILLTYALQGILLIGMPVPSPVSLGRSLAASRAVNGSDGANRIPLSRVLARGGLMATALAGALAPLLVYLAPSSAPYLTAIPMPESIWRGFLSALLLLAGNAMILAAVWTLRRKTRFNAAGESEHLLTAGIFGCLRHPVVAGMGLVYAGFFLAVPCAWTLAGLVAYAFHQGSRLKAEEALLAARFGRQYAEYCRAVGRFGPRRRSAGPEKES